MGIYARKRGIQLHSPDELVLPGDAAPRFLRADEVKNAAEGYSLVN